MNTLRDNPDVASYHHLRPDQVMKAVAGVAAVAALAAGCSPEAGSTPSEERYTVAAAKLESGAVDAGVNVRHDPEVLEDEGYGDSNACGTTPENFEISESYGLYAPKYDANDGWIGINSHTEGLPEECTDDADATVWINEKYYKGGATLNDPVLTMKIPRD